MMQGACRTDWRPPTSQATWGACASAPARIRTWVVVIPMTETMPVPKTYRVRQMFICMTCTIVPKPEARRQTPTRSATRSCLTLSCNACPWAGNAAHMRGSHCVILGSGLAAAMMRGPDMMPPTIAAACWNPCTCHHVSAVMTDQLIQSSFASATTLQGRAYHDDGKQQWQRLVDSKVRG